MVIDRSDAAADRDWRDAGFGLDMREQRDDVGVCRQRFDVARVTKSQNRSQSEA